MALLICWQIWKERNIVVFQNGTTNPRKIILLATKLGEEYFKSNKANKKVCKENLTIKWSLPLCGNLKINFDGSVINDHLLLVLL